MHDVLERQRLEVELVGGVVVGGHGLRVAVDHDGLVADFLQRERGVYAAIVELDALADAVRAATEDHDLLLVAVRSSLALQTPGRIHVWRERGELCGARVDARVNRPYVELRTPSAHVLRRLSAERRDLAIAETELFGGAKRLLVERFSGGRLERSFVLDDLTHLLEEPNVDVRRFVNVVHRESNSKTVGDIPETLAEWSPDEIPNRFTEVFLRGFRQIGKHRFRRVDGFPSVDEASDLGGEVAIVDLPEKRGQPAVSGFE